MSMKPAKQATKKQTTVPTKLKTPKAIKKVHPRSRLPGEAEAEILSALAQDMRISRDRIDEILRKHGVSGDPAALQRSYRLAVGQRLMASMRDENGRREVLAVSSDEGGTEYIVVDGCNDARQLKAVRQKLHSQIAGLENSSGKVKSRLRFLERIRNYIPGQKREGGAANGS